MTHKEWPELARAYHNRVRAMIEGDRVMHEVSYKERDTEWHLSEFDLCLLPAVYRRQMPQPPQDDESILLFFRGRVIERAIAQESEPICVDGIWMTMDDATPPLGLKVAEIKSTEWGMHNFKPLNHWTSRGMGYCYGHEATEMGLLVFFLSGNIPNFNEWKAELRPEKGTPKIKTAMRGWHIEFEQGELEAHWEDVLRRKEWCERVLVGAEPDRETIDLHRPAWQCKKCQWTDMCKYQATKELRIGA